MTFEEMQTAIDALVPMMAEKGLRMPAASLQIKSNEEPMVIVAWAAAGETWPRQMEFLRGANPQEALAKARAWIDVLPTSETRHAREFLRLSATAVDYGRENGIPDQFIAPIAANIQAMTENLLTDGRGV